MSYLISSLVFVPPVINDVISVQIKDAALTHTVFQYHVTNAAHQIYREGSFRGLRLQLRLSHLENGEYYFVLQSNELDKCSFVFEKVSKVIVTK